MRRVLCLLFFGLLTSKVTSEDAWVLSPSGLIVPRIYPSVVLYNRTLVVVGGCANVGCDEYLSDIVAYVPQIEMSWQLGTIPVRLSVPNTNPQLPPALIPLSVAGPTAATVAYDNQGNERVWIVGSCVMLSLTHGDNATRHEIHSTAWGLSYDLSTLGVAVRVPASEPLRANASCHAVGSFIFIVGGVDLETLSPLSSIDVIDTSTSTYHADVASLPTPVVNAAVASDSELMYIVGNSNTHVDERETSAAPVWAIDIPSIGRQGILNVTLRNLPPVPLVGSEGAQLRVMPFGGIVAVTAGTATMYTWKARLANPQGTWDQLPLRLLPLSHTTVVAFPLTSYDGVSLLLYSCGGIDHSSGESPSKDVWIFRTPLTLSGITELPPLVIVGQLILLPFEPIVSGFVRLSNTPQCLAPTAGTIDVYVNITEAVSDGLIPEAEFFPLTAVARAYVCFSAEVQTQTAAEGVFFTVITPNNPMRIVHPFVPSPPTTVPSSITPPGGTPSTFVVAGIVGGSIFVFFFIAAVVAWRWKQGPSRRGQGDDDDRAEPIARATRGGKYEMVRKIGQGAFSNVYLVRRHGDGIFMALKLILCVDDRSRLEAIRECETIHTIQGHPNIIKLYDMSMSYEFAEPEMGSGMSLPNEAERRTSSTMDRGTPRESLLNSPRTRVAQPTRYLCLVTQYHPEGDLCKYLLTQLGSRSPMTLTEPILKERQLLSVAQQLTSALAHIHQQRPPIVHRDVKPENVLISGPMTESVIPVVVTDFGLAFLLEERRKCGHGGGTRPYIAPEVWRGQATTASDMWSLGCVLFAISTVRLTVDSVRLMSEEAKHPSFAQGIRHELQKLGLSEEWSRLIASLLQEAPKSRPTAAALLDVFDVRSDGSVSIRANALPCVELS